MNGIDRKFARRPLSLADLADLLERHIGAGTDEHLCKEASDALLRYCKNDPNFYLRATLRSLEPKGQPCARVRKAIATLRKWRYASGA